MLRRFIRAPSRLAAACLAATPNMAPCTTYSSKLPSLLTQTQRCCHTPKATTTTTTSTEAQEEEEQQRIAQFQHIWRRFATAPKDPKTGFSQPPPWYVQLCYDLHFRVNANENDDLARVEDGNEETSSDVVVDPFAYISVNLFEEEAYRFAPYAFPREQVFNNDSTILDALCLHNREKEYMCFGEIYAFPDRKQIPTSVGTDPAMLWVDPTAKEPTVLIQLGKYFPPLTWIPVRADAAAVRRVLSEFAQFAVYHRDMHHHRYVHRREVALQSLKNQNMPYDEPNVLRYMSRLAKDVQAPDAPLREYPNSQEFFLGEFDDAEKMLEHIESCPFVFSIPHMRISTMHLHAKTYDGGVAMSVFRCIHSKAVLFVKAHLGTEVKLPPTEHNNFNFIWNEETQLPATRTPVFARIVWPNNTRMCGGGPLIARLNRELGTEFAKDTPIDAAMALFYCACWSKRRGDFMGVLGMRKRVDELEHAYASGPRARITGPGSYPSTKEIPSPEYTPAETLAMHLQYLAHLGDPEIVPRLKKWSRDDSGAVRLGCAKASLERANWDLFREIVRAEPPGRQQDAMLRLVRLRKKRDLLDRAPRILESEFTNTVEEVAEYNARMMPQHPNVDPMKVPHLNPMTRLYASGFPNAPPELPRVPNEKPLS
eukprot:PhM_4_TR13056/c0_g1_i1/m.99545